MTFPDDELITTMTEYRGKVVYQAFTFILFTTVLYGYPVHVQKEHIKIGLPNIGMQLLADNKTFIMLMLSIIYGLMQYN